MNRLDIRRREVQSRGEKALTCLLPLGDPDLKTSIRLAGLYKDAGVDIVELGMPSENPYCDSKEISESNRRSLAAHPDLEEYFECWKEIRSMYPDEPFEVMAYSDTLSKVGASRFVEALAEADLDGHLLADGTEIGPELVGTVEDLLKPLGIYRIRWMPHPFREELLDDIATNARGFMILQSFADNRGERATVAMENRGLIERIRSTGTSASILLAYGINNGQRAREAVALGPDGILVGTAMVNRIAEQDYSGLETTVRELKAATRV
jgi:tryptophan synthase alpha chain